MFVNDVKKGLTMVNKKFWFGIPVLVLVFAMIGCDNNPEGGWLAR